MPTALEKNQQKSFTILKGSSFHCTMIIKAAFLDSVGSQGALFSEGCGVVVKDFFLVQ